MLVAILNFLRAWRRYNASLKELSARRQRIGRYRHYAVGHSAHRMGQFPARKFLNKSARSGGRFCFLLALVLVSAFWTRPARWHLGHRAGLICAVAPQGLSGPGDANTFAPW